MSAWTCNIGVFGRVIRGTIGLAAGATGVYLLMTSDYDFLATGLCTLGGFAVFEGVVGWCAIKAMGINTPF